MLISRVIWLMLVWLGGEGRKKGRKDNVNQSESNPKLFIRGGGMKMVC